MNDTPTAPDPPSKYLAILAIGMLIVGFLSSYFNIAQGPLVWLMIAAPVVFGAAIILDALLVGVSDLDSGARELIYALVGAFVPILSVLYWSRRAKLRRQYRDTHGPEVPGKE